MADNQLPRIRTSYLLGLSNKPFKDPPKPPPLNSYRGMLRTPGAAIEWAASDGRRGRLMGKGKSRLLSTLDAAAPQNQVNASANMNASQGVPNNPAQSGSGGNEASDQPSSQAASSGEVEYKKGVPSKDFLEEEDRTIMRMKIDDKQWGDIMKHMNGKSKKQCTQRFNEIRPDDFYEKRNAAKGNGRSGKQGNQNDQKQNNKGQDKKEEKTEWGTGHGGWDPMAVLGGVFGDDRKSNASDKGSKQSEKPGDTTWAGTGNDWAALAADGNENNTGGNAGWTNGGDHNNAAVTAPWGNLGGDNTASGAAPSDNNGGGDWNQHASGGKDNNKRGEGKKSKHEKKQEKRGKSNERSNKKESKPDAAVQPWETANDSFGNGGGGATTGFGDSGGWDFDNNEDKKSESKKSKKSSSRSSKASSKNAWGADRDNGGAGTVWDAADGGGGGRQGWTENTDGYTGGGWGDNKADTGGAQASSKDHEKYRSSHRRSSSLESKHRSHRHLSSSHPTEYKVAPDSTFSQDELKLIARILQQDCSMVWERVSWRFKDKTGRNLEPNIFEKKITGRLKKERRH
ncbi:hypothetical protein PSPO01_14115 [Paraphaeosphaeria sporulosa]